LLPRSYHGHLLRLSSPSRDVFPLSLGSSDVLPLHPRYLVSMPARKRRDETLAPGRPSGRALLLAPERLAYFSVLTQFQES